MYATYIRLGSHHIHLCGASVITSLFPFIIFMNMITRNHNTTFMNMITRNCYIDPCCNMCTQVFTYLCCAQVFTYVCHMYAHMFANTHTHIPHSPVAELAVPPPPALPLHHYCRRSRDRLMTLSTGLQEASWTWPL